MTVSPYSYHYAMLFPNIYTIYLTIKNISKLKYIQKITSFYQILSIKYFLLILTVIILGEIDMNLSKFCKEISCFWADSEASWKLWMSLAWEVCNFWKRKKKLRNCYHHYCLHQHHCYHHYHFWKQQQKDRYIGQ